RVRLRPRAVGRGALGARALRPRHRRRADADRRRARGLLPPVAPRAPARGRGRRPRVPRPGRGHARRSDRRLLPRGPARPRDDRVARVIPPKDNQPSATGNHTPTPAKGSKNLEDPASQALLAGDSGTAPPPEGVVQLAEIFSLALASLRKPL